MHYSRLLLRFFRVHYIVFEYFIYQAASYRQCCSVRAHTLLPLQPDLSSPSEPNCCNPNTDNHVRKHKPIARPIPLQHSARIAAFKRPFTPPTLLILDTQCDNLTTAHAQTHPKLANCVEHRTSQGLRFLREAIADDDQAHGIQHVCAEGRKDLGPECEFPVRPGRIHECHAERGERADERGTADEQARGHAVYEHAYADVKEDARGEVGEKVE